MAHILQHEVWLHFQQALGRHAVTLQGEGWSANAYLEQSKFGSRLYAPYGPVVATPDALHLALDALKEKAKELDATYLRVEPMVQAPHLPAVPKRLLIVAGLHEVPHRQPKFTRRVNLSQPFDQVLSQMTSSIRNAHRNYLRRGLSFHSSQQPEDVEILIRLMRDVTDRTGMVAHSPEYLRAQARALLPEGHATLFFIQLEGEPNPIAAAMVFDDKHRRYYIHSAADTAHRKFRASGLLITLMMEDASNHGIGEFDLYGIVPQHIRDHSWTGFSDFKLAFGGEQVTFSGTWELPIKHVRYAMYRMATRLFALTGKRARVVPAD